MDLITGGIDINRRIVEARCAGIVYDTTTTKERYFVPRATGPGTCVGATCKHNVKITGIIFRIRYVPVSVRAPYYFSLVCIIEDIAAAPKRIYGASSHGGKWCQEKDRE